MADMTERIDRLRDGVLAVDAESLRVAVRSLPRSVSAALHAAAGTPFPALGRLPDPTRPLRRVSDVHLLVAVAEGVAQPSLDLAIELLGEAADDPTIEQLRAIMPELVERFPLPMVRLLFASIAIGNAPAADKCDEILVHDLPALDVAEDGDGADDEASDPADTSSARDTTAANDEVRETRRARRRAQQDARRKQQDARARGEQARRDATRRASHTVTPAHVPHDDRVVVDVTRRVPQLTAEQAKEFDADDDLVGSVVIALVAFDDESPAQPGPQQKLRPCIVIGASTSQLLVRPCYSDGGRQSRRWQSHELRGWVAAGLDRPTWVEDAARVVARADAADPVGRVTAEDWNALW